MSDKFTKCIIIEDERLARVELKRLLTDYKELQLVGEASNEAEAIDLIDRFQPDLIFLDIQLPGTTGFDLLEKLDSIPKVIFTTAFDEYAIKAFEYNALDYLLKPIDPSRLQSAIQKLGIVEAFQTETEKPTHSNQKFLTENDQVFVKDGDRCWFVKLCDIRLFESDGNYVRLYFYNEKPLILKTLNELESRLDPEKYFRANRKHIINLNFVADLKPWFNGGLMVKLTDGLEVEISRRQAIRFKEQLSL